jgi:dihydroxy-acid dehydratase
MKELDGILHRKCITANGKTIKENYSNSQICDANIIASIDKPFNKEGGLAVLKGNICEEGAVIKPSAASLRLMQHTGKAIVFENIEEYQERIDADDLEVDETNVLILKNVGPKGYPGMPEVGNMGLPKKLLAKGVLDMIRISDGRMSGTGFGTVVLHVSPEAALGGNFAVLKTGDLITLDVANRTLKVELSDEELQKRKAQFTPLPPIVERGYVNLYINHVQQAHLGTDLDFLRGNSGSLVTKDSH